jgi:hypothetical protein
MVVFLTYVAEPQWVGLMAEGDNAGAGLREDYDIFLLIINML